MDSQRTDKGSSAKAITSQNWKLKIFHKSKQKNSLDLRQRIGYNVIVVNRYSQQRKKQSEVATLQTAPRKTFNFCVDFYKKVKNTSFTILL